MTIPVNTIDELQKRIANYLMIDRPLNLDEMRNASEVINNVVENCKDLIRYSMNHKLTPLEGVTVQVLQKNLGLGVWH